MNDGRLLGYDVGSSSVKAVILEASTGEVMASATSPRSEMEIASPQPGWAEQHPDLWWTHMAEATRMLREHLGVPGLEVEGIGISYQMHGLVIVGDGLEVLRPAIIWCDSRAVETGARALEEIGHQRCLERLLNSPGNFTASKLRWVRENEPDVYARVQRAMLPGDYLAARLTGEIATTASGLSEATLWDYPDGAISRMLLHYYDIDPSLIPPPVSTFSVQGRLGSAAASELGIAEGTPVSYRAGDQPNNAFSLRVLEPGEVAATAGTSGVVYGVVDRATHDPRSRVNTFVHVNHDASRSRYGILLCVNGTGILNSWMRANLFGTGGTDYQRMNELADEIDPGSDGLLVFPFGNGAERTLENRDLGASVEGLRFPRHDIRHLCRAAQEGIVFSLAYGLEIMRAMGLELSTLRAGHANMFLSRIFASAFATVTGSAVELYNTDGAQGAARGAGVGAGVYADAADAFAGLRAVQSVEPDAAAAGAYTEAYRRWVQALELRMR